MKSLKKNYANVFRFALAILLFVAALAINTFIDRPVLKQYFPYVPVILLVVATWVLYKLDGRNLRAIGLNLKAKTVSFLFLGLLIGAVAFLLASYARSLYTGEAITLSSSIDYRTVVTSIYFILPTIAVEELLFRGYLFKKTIKVSNVVVANIIFSILFMLIHLVDESVLSNPGHMVLLIISIPVGHLWFATALQRSKTLFFPIGLHLGNNWATRHLISDNGNGESILVVLERVNFETWPSFIGMLLITNGVFLLVALLIWKVGK